MTGRMYIRQICLVFSKVLLFQVPVVSGTPSLRDTLFFQEILFGSSLILHQLVLNNSVNSP